MDNNNRKDCPKVPQVPQVPVTSDMAYKLDQVLELMQSQACQITELKYSIEMENNTEDNKFKIFSKNIEQNLTKMIEEHMTRYDREHAKKLEAFIAERDKQKLVLCETIVDSIAPLVTSQLTEKLSTIVMTAMQRNVGASITDHLNKIKAQMHFDVVHELSGYDQVMMETITKISSSKLVMETLGKAVAFGIQAGLQKTYLDTLKSIIIPAYQKTTEEMLQHIQTVLMQGTKSYTKQCEAYMSQAVDNSMALLLNMPEELKRINKKTFTNLTDQIHSGLKALQVNLIQSLRENVKNEIQKGFENQVASIYEFVSSPVQSQCHTPAPTLHNDEEEIRQHLVQGRINTAFDQALASSNLRLVEFTLENADYAQVFFPCSLQQPVLISLIQHISAEMNNHNDLKHSYLIDATDSLDFRDATTREHAPKIMRELDENFENFITANPNSPLVRRIKMLKKVVLKIARLQEVFNRQEFHN